MKKVLKWAAIVVLAIIVLFIISIPIINRGMGEVKALKINPVDLYSLSDDVYTGNYCRTRWCFSVEVEVRAHQMVSIEIVDARMNSLKKVTDELTGRILDKQQVTVDAYTGATVTSKAVLKAVENALTNE